MKILHISAECYPAAKAGGLGDVVGALPKYQTQMGTSAAVIIPKYTTKWLSQQEYDIVYEGLISLGNYTTAFSIEKVDANNSLGFDLYVANIPSQFDRPNMYSYWDDPGRFIAFQLAVLTWVRGMSNRPSFLHCHDHHTGFIPFLAKYAYDFKTLNMIPTIFTIHNGEYSGAFPWKYRYLLPYFPPYLDGMIDWDGQINPLAAAVKNCWKYSTVSSSYLAELRAQMGSMAWLIGHEASKSKGILNGIDTTVWNPKSDALINTTLKRSIDKYKRENKEVLTERFGLDKDLPLITFIGRLVHEKGAELIPNAIAQFLMQGKPANFIVLGTGSPAIHEAMQRVANRFPQYFGLALEYNEGLAHQLYAGSDFLLMPSRVEPCGLNQMYAMCYGTVPIVRSIGGLKDTVIDVKDSESDGRGICFDVLSADNIANACHRAVELYEQTDRFKALVKHIMSLDFSWERSAKTYLEWMEA